MSSPDLQIKLLERFESLKRGAEAAAKCHSDAGNDSNYTFHSGRVKAFADCIRELEKTIEESK